MILYELKEACDENVGAPAVVTLCSCDVPLQLCTSAPPIEAPLELLRWYRRRSARNPEIQAARSQWEATREQVPQVTTLPDPTFGVQLWNIPQNGNLGSSVTRTQNTIYTLSQKFPFPANYL